ncbi:MAG: arginase family protein, partial [Hyphomicrobiales bacterium]|nr:arginase family protein [Hyphomicrobiales bacterium]
WPLLKAHAERHGTLALIQFDAHQDTWSDDGERLDHGTFVARAVKEGIVDPARSIQIGIRTQAPYDFDIEIIDADAFAEIGPAAVASRILARVGATKTYLTVDIDCLDPAFAPGTGTPVAGGLTSGELLRVIRRLGALNLVGADVTEVAPAYDHADITAIAAATVARDILALIAKKRR